LFLIEFMKIITNFLNKNLKRLFIFFIFFSVTQCSSSMKLEPPSVATSKTASSEKDVEQKKEFFKNVKSKIRELNDYVAKNAEFVGDKFVSEVRSIHYDKKKKRNIYGNATLEETKELQEEGIDVATIPWAPKEDA
jgi:hypothetical protein